MNDRQFQRLDHEDMVSITHKSQIMHNLKIFRVKELYEFFRSSMALTDESQPNYQWLGDGIEARLLKASHSNAGWTTGRARLALAFQPDRAPAIVKRPICDLPELDDILELNDLSAGLIQQQSMQVSEVYWQVRQKLKINEPIYSNYYWVDRGIECEVMKSSGELAGWQSGLIRLQFEFVPVSKNPMGENSTVSQVGLDSLRQLAVN
jgi:hypothetical protein